MGSAAQARGSSIQVQEGHSKDDTEACYGLSAWCHVARCNTVKVALGLCAMAAALESKQRVYDSREFKL